mmetsp:Transcript_35051/g.79573  ORF Transcript_35051/g.79573 Transcript_35051/m.79573 type:complete len:107 (+) Transcript_35051:165-485(+)
MAVPGHSVPRQMMLYAQAPHLYLMPAASSRPPIRILHMCLSTGYPGMGSAVVAWMTVVVGGPVVVVRVVVVPVVVVGVTVVNVVVWVVVVAVVVMVFVVGIDVSGR